MTARTHARRRPLRGLWTLVAAALALALPHAAVAAVPLTAPGSAGARSSGSLARSRPPDGAPPRLVVLVVVDQLGWNVLHRYEGAFRGGFRRLLDGGTVYENAVYDHAQTSTGPGHATLATGVEPARHGIVGNEWYEGSPGDRRLIQNTEDDSVSIVGVPGATGRSPHWLLRDGLADWLEAAQPDARVVSVSRKPRGAILPAGRGHRPLVYWLSYRAGAFVTSTWYRKRDPAWVTEFDRDSMPLFAADTVWRPEVPRALRSLARDDEAPYENRGGPSVFPHRLSSWLETGEHASDVPGDASPVWTFLAETPATDEASLAFARQAVRTEGLGSDTVPDLLEVSLSSTDAIGHRYGPYSLEQLDNLWRLDRELGSFLDFLDRTVGRGRYVLALTGDHGIPPMPEFAARAGIPAGHVHGDTAALLGSVAGDAARSAAGGGPDEAARSAARAVERLPFVARAYVLADLYRTAPGDSLDVYERHSQRRDRWTATLPGLGVDVVLRPYFVPSAHDTHGSPWLYDRHVPLLLYGSGQAAHRVEGRVRMVDLAPTLARILGVPAPPDLDGRPLGAPFGDP